MPLPLIERIGPGQQTELQIRVKAVAAGPAICNVELHHAGENGADEKVEDYGHFKITDTKK